MASSCGSICPVNGDFLSYQPNLGANAFLLAAFAVLVPVTFVLGLRFQAPVFATILTAGLVLEVVGFLGRVLLSSIQGSATYTLLWLLGTVLGPTFISASIFVVLPHTLSIYGQQLSPVTPFVAGVLAGSFIVAAAVLQLVGIIFLVFESRNLSVSQLRSSHISHALANQAQAIPKHQCYCRRPGTSDCLPCRIDYPTHLAAV